jgi:hypothetical protein
MGAKLMESKEEFSLFLNVLLKTPLEITLQISGELHVAAV